jgi:hypothetical protein
VKVNEDIEKRKKIDKIINHIHKQQMELGILDEEDLREVFVSFLNHSDAELLKNNHCLNTRRAGRLIEVGG